jgi:hypothetical protein
VKPDEEHRIPVPSGPGWGGRLNPDVLG